VCPDLVRAYRRRFQNEEKNKLNKSAIEKLLGTTVSTADIEK
jgi:hypothetical protein